MESTFEELPIPNAKKVETNQFNSFVPDVPFLYPLLGGRKKVHWE